jgi:hypothetical protein
MKITTTTALIFSGLVLGACTPIEPSGDLFLPVDIGTPEQTASEPSVVEEQEPTVAPVDSPTITAEDEALFGPEPLPQEEPPPETVPQTEALERLDSSTTTAPNITLWGLRLVSTINDTTPPRAVLALTTGEEIVVRAGQMLPDAQMVILAVGQDVIQVANITPDGDRALVESVTLNAFNPNRDTRE